MIHRTLQGALIALAVALGLAGCERETGPKRYTGYVEAEFVYVASPGSGWLVQAPFKAGDTVSIDDVLFELDHRLQEAELLEASDRMRQAEAQAQDIAKGAREEEIAALEAQLKEAEANADFARSERARWIKLVDRGVAAEERADQVIAEHEAAAARVVTIEAEISVARLGGRDDARAAAAAGIDAAAAVLSQAQWRLDQRQAHAMVDGRVDDVFQRVGEFVTAGTPVLAVLPENALKVRFFVPEAELSWFAPGTVVDIHVDGEAHPLAAEVSYIANEAEFTPPVIYSVGSREKLVFLIEARLQQPASARPGQPVEVARR